MHINLYIIYKKTCIKVKIDDATMVIKDIILIIDTSSETNIPVINSHISDRLSY